MRVGRYELLFELARGGMGSVFIGRLVGAHGFDRLVAIKRLRGNDDTQSVASLLAEARLTARIHHPNVVQTLELGEHDGSPFIVMQLVEGASLAQLTRALRERGSSLNENLAAWIFAQAATGLHAAHELTGDEGEPLGLVHRDVSPQNVLLSYDGRVCIADFGIAKQNRAAHETESGIVKGKFAYMSPEQARARRLDRRSDIFSLGIVLYESLTGRRLFDGDSPADTLLRIVELAPESLRVARPGLSETLEAIVLRCLEKQPDARYPSAAALADDLRAYLAASNAHVDETVLAALMTELFEVQRVELRERVREATRRRPIATEQPERSAPDVATPSGPGALGRPRRKVAALAAAGATAIAIAAWAAVRPTTPLVRPTTLSAPTFTSAPSELAHGADASEPAATASAATSAAATAFASSAPDLGARTAIARRAPAAPEPSRTISPKPTIAPASPAPTPASSATVAPSSSRGVPFQAL